MAEVQSVKDAERQDGRPKNVGVLGAVKYLHNPKENSILAESVMANARMSVTFKRSHTACKTDPFFPKKYGYVRQKTRFNAKKSKDLYSSVNRGLFHWRSRIEKCTIQSRIELRVL